MDDKKTTEIDLLNYLDEQGYDPIGAADTRMMIMNYARGSDFEGTPEEILQGWLDFGKALEEEFTSDSFLHGMDVGESLGASRAAEEARAAYEMGEIELWLEFHTPKSFEDWEAWEAKHGPTQEFSKRWKTS